MKIKKNKELSQIKSNLIKDNDLNNLNENL